MSSCTRDAFRGDERLMDVGSVPRACGTDALMASAGLLCLILVSFSLSSCFCILFSLSISCSLSFPRSLSPSLPLSLSPSLPLSLSLSLSLSLLDVGVEAGHRQDAYAGAQLVMCTVRRAPCTVHRCSCSRLPNLWKGASLGGGSSRCS